MKKLVAFILSFVYLAASTGATVHMHYCMDKLVDWSLTHNDSGTCSNCGMDKEDAKEGCCKDEHKQIKLEADQKIADAAAALVHLALLSTTPGSHLFTFEPEASIAHDFPVSHAPPVSPGRAIYLRNCVFRI